MRDQCDIRDAVWYVELIIGKTFCPEMESGRRCTDRRDHDYRYGTETTTVDGWYDGDRPSAADRREMVPEGWYLIESTAKPCR